ncbi:hypothetical protein ACRDU6_14710 [Mycolicibacterium sp. ELW1]|uniref:hypothetical protein n=1 Tax=Mycobacteriaceae TaxID=1762 RepID=UPI0011EDEDCD|nr:hypothetical protein [Mycobacterium sp. ELW1]QEN13749.1 hypothetical protein D3H54_11275 [Mycobacterium sp. ELW1]
MTNHCQADPNDVAACAIEGCTYSDSEGILARGGMTQLRDFLSADPEPAGSDGFGCSCRKCTGFARPLSPEDIERVLAHVSPRMATLYAMAKLNLHGIECDDCGAPAPLFTDGPGSTDGVFGRRRCPYHDHLLKAVQS